MENSQNEGIHHQKVWAVITVARQIEGEWQVLRSEKAFTDPNKAEAYAEKLNKGFVDPANPRKRMAIKISTEHGDIACSCLAGVYEMELEE